MSYETIIVETRGQVGLIRLNRPQALNALNSALIRELSQAVDAFETNGDIGCMLITGSEKAFAAGADIKEMVDKTFNEAFLGNFIGQLALRRASAQAGDRRGRGFCARRRLRARHAMRHHHRRRQRQVRSARDQARGHSRHRRHAALHPRRRQGEGDGHHAHRPDDGCGGSRALRPRGAHRAGGKPDGGSHQSRGDDRVDVASLGAGGKRSGQRAFETSLAEGVRFERSIFHSLFATADQKEGMAAFIAKRPPSSRTNSGCVTSYADHAQDRLRHRCRLASVGGGRRCAVGLQKAADGIGRQHGSALRHRAAAGDDRRLKSTMPAKRPWASTAAAPEKPGFGVGSRPCAVKRAGTLVTPPLRRPAPAGRRRRRVSARRSECPRRRASPARDCARRRAEGARGHRSCRQRRARRGRGRVR